MVTVITALAIDVDGSTAEVNNRARTVVRVAVECACDPASTSALQDFLC
jgi:hypothetical protein